VRFKRGRSFSTFALLAAGLFVYGRTHKHGSGKSSKPVVEHTTERRAESLSADDRDISTIAANLGVSAVKCEVRTWLADADVEIVPDDPGSILPAVWTAHVKGGTLDTLVPGEEGSAKIVREGVAVGSMKWDHAMTGDIVPCIDAGPIPGGQATASLYEHPPADEAAREGELARVLGNDH
jgi:hypothetical protein